MWEYHLSCSVVWLCSHPSYLLLRARCASRFVPSQAGLLVTGWLLLLWPETLVHLWEQIETLGSFWAIGSPEMARNQCLGLIWDWPKALYSLLVFVFCYTPASSLCLSHTYFPEGYLGFRFCPSVSEENWGNTFLLSTLSHPSLYFLLF